MAATAQLRPAAGFGENKQLIKIFASGKLVMEIFVYKNAYDAAKTAVAQDGTDIDVHVSTTLQGLTPYAVTTIS